MYSKTYSNTEVKMHKGGKKTVRKVYIKNGKGYKTITKYHKGRKHSHVKKPICESHIMLIQNGKFVRGLFSDCNIAKNSTRRRK